MLNRLAASLVGQLRDGDEVVVVGDTHGNDLTGLAQWVEAQPHWRYLEHDAGRNAWGHPQINYGMEHAEGDYILFQDDDDIYYPDALNHVRRVVRHLKPPRPVLFKFRGERYGGQTFWIEQGRVEIGMIGGHCIVAPNDPERLGQWSDRYEGDFDFIVETLAKYEPLKPVWRQEVIVHAR